MASQKLSSQGLVEAVERADLGTTTLPVNLLKENTSYNSREIGRVGDGPLPPREGYELNDINEQKSNLSLAAPLSSSQDPSIQKGSREPSFLDPMYARYSRIRRHFVGWKLGVLLCAVAAITVCLLNIIVTIWVTKKHPSADGLSYVYRGSCSEVKSLGLWIHLAINVMSTILLSASNYTMQILSSPTRKEMDTAHQKGRWLDIGIPSIRNLRSISRGRLVMWSLLALSSIPLHFLYNTTVFSSTTANTFDRIVVTEGFLQPGAPFNTDIQYGLSDISAALLTDMHTSALNGSLTRLDNSDCMARFAKPFVTDCRNVLLVTTYTDPNQTYLESTVSWATDEIPYAWLCGPYWSANPYREGKDVCTLSKAQAGASNWTVFDYPISHCLVQEVEEACQLRFSLAIMIIVILANATKASLMLATWWNLQSPTLVTLGDAVASFLDTPDSTTAGACLTTNADVRKGRVKWIDQGKKLWVPKREYWFRAASVRRWLICNILCWFVIIFGIVLLRLGMEGEGIYDLKSLWQVGFGQANPNAVVGGLAPKNLIGKVLLANLPQAVLSFLYLTYNGLYSCMLSAHEWTHFTARRTLRVSNPVGQQRSTYYLQLTYWFAVPLLILSAILHWLVSQSLFLAFVDYLNPDGTLDSADSISTVGYSCIAIFFAIIVGVIAMLAGVANGFRRYDDGIPLVGSCSAAISAACHRPNEDASASLLPIKWGCVDASAETEVGHCCLTSFEVTRPADGRYYAGKDEGK